MRGQAKGRGRAGSQQQQASGQRQLPHAQTSSEAVRKPGQAAASAPSTSGGRGEQHHTEKGDSGVQSLGRGIEKLAVSGDGGGDASSQPSRRGMTRGRRALPVDILNTRPTTLTSKKGITGTPIMLETNYFKLLKLTDWSLHQYRVDFKPEEDNTFVRKGLLKVHKRKLGNFIFDGTVMYSSVLFPKEMILTSKRDSDDEIITIVVRLVGDLVIGDAHFLQFFNIIMRKCYEKLKLQLVGRNYFDPNEKTSITRHKMEVWPGYISSIRQHETEILMNVELANKVMRSETIHDIYIQIRSTHGDHYKTVFDKAVINTVVITNYNNRTYTIDDIDYDANPTSTFIMKDGRKISYIDYYKTKTSQRIRDLTQPLLVSKSKVKVRQGGPPDLIFLVPELCNATGLTDTMRDNYQLMKALADHTRLKPEVRIQKLLRFNRRLNSKPEIAQELKDWNLQLDTKLLPIPGRVLPNETITFGQGQRDVTSEGDWTKQMQRKSCTSVVELKDWVIVVPERNRGDVEANFIKTLRNVSNGLKFPVAYPTIYTIPDDRANTYNIFLERLLSKKIPQLVFCVAPNNRSDRYSTIKKKCCVDRPVPSQVALTRTLGHQSLVSIATKIAIQMNCKIGGSPWYVDIPINNLMTVGFDVSHDTMDKSKDFGAMVASLNKTMTRYYSTVSAHEDGDELSKDLCTNIVKAVQAYQQLNNLRPSYIIIYRDGVGEGQLPQVMEREVKEIRKSLDALYGGRNYRFAFVVVTKRLNTRLFNNGKNPISGTVVDDVITNPLKYDFFIVSQQVRQGTVTPTSYNILDEDFGLGPDKMQRLTYKMTHMYFNCSNTVRVPAPCHYAHKLAFLISRYVHSAPNNYLQNLLYFL